MARSSTVRRSLAIFRYTLYNQGASMDLKEKFYKIYNNLPLNLRDEVILVLENEPITWKVARLEVDQDTKLSRIILEKLTALRIL